MEKKNLILPICLTLGVILFIGLASATITIVTPTSGLAVSGNYTFNVTTTQTNVANCTFATTSDGVFSTLLNSSTGQTVFNITNDTTSLTEVLATTLTVTCTNSSNDQETKTVTFDIDNTAPTCSFIIDREFVERQSGLGISTDDSSSDTTTLTYSWVLTNDAGTSKATYTSTEPTFSNGDLEDLGEHTITLTLTDEVSKTASCTKTFMVQGSSTDDDDEVGESIGEGIIKNKSNLMWMLIIFIGVLLIVVIGVASWYVIENSKKKK